MGLLWLSNRNVNEQDQSQADKARIAEALKALNEHFDSVAIFVTRHEGNESGTTRIVDYDGNFYASFGWIAAWLEFEKGRMYERGHKAENTDD